MTSGERVAYNAQIDEFIKKRQETENQRHADCRQKAESIWTTAQDASPEHPYLITKQVKSHGIRESGDDLIVPVMGSDGVLHGLQFIQQNGVKRFLPGTAVKGSYFTIGEIANKVLICEGYATGATLHEVTGEAVVIAFNAGNLKPVAEALRMKMPGVVLMICADDDYVTEGNPGMTKATEAANAVNGKLAIPVFPSNRGVKDTDFNDLFRLAGGEAVRGCVVQKDYLDEIILDGATWMQEELEEPDVIIEKLLNVGDKLVLIGGSKAKKSFAALQLMICVAAGKNFLNWRIPRPRRVTLIQFEVQPVHFHKRLQWISRGLKITPAMLGDRIKIINARGLPGFTDNDPMAKVCEIIARTKPELVFLDPLYKLINGDEKSNGDDGMKPLLAKFDRIATEFYTAISYAHHDTKGNQASKSNVDRGSGGGILGRDFDSSLIITPHVSSPDLLVLDSVTRNYKPLPSRTIEWIEDIPAERYCFTLKPEVAAVRASTGAITPAQASFESHVTTAREILKDTKMAMVAFKEKFRQAAGIGRNNVDNFVRWGRSPDVNLFIVDETFGKSNHTSVIAINEDYSTNDEMINEWIKDNE
jgi:hypothetical protein